ncbi:MAG: hypothetical protein HY706_07495, partial [Candidatus Hydrogenedentes bacterium]|nr:hypothetical protein [Candidatus Hydrogenedentota bacterium]
MEPTKDRVNTTVSPRCWGLAPSDRRDSRYLDTMGLPKAQLELRARKNTYEWLLKQFNNDVGAFYGYYDPRTRAFAAPQTCNLIAPFQLIAAFDR